jgi:D-alanyl-D-alanine carboxypeptidase (penicillin-binding protein 5/6)
VTDLRVLEAGRMRRGARDARRRRQRRRRRIRRSILALLVLGIALVGLVLSGFGRGTSPRSRAADGAARARAATVAPAPSRPAVPAPPAYGRTPDSVQIRHPHLKLALRSGLLFDVRTGHVLWRRDPTRRLPIASLTKMMTALIVTEHPHAGDKVLITTAATHFTGSGVGLLPLHKRVSERALLYGLLLPSGNDAAIALAQHVAGNQRRFISLMNAKTRAMRLPCTHFTTVSGVVDAGNRSCAADLAVIAHQLLTAPRLARIVATPSAILPFPIKGGKLYLYNNNPLMIARYPGADGVKTGYTQQAGLCIVAAARRGRNWLAVVLLHSANWLTQAETLLDDGFAALSPAKR